MRFFKRTVLIILPISLCVALYFAGKKHLDVVLLSVACEARPGQIASLLERGADPKVTSRNGITPLHHVAMAGGNTNGGLDNSTKISMLVGHGADVNVLEDDCISPLHYAIMAQNPISVGALLRFGARVDVKSKRFGTPLQSGKNSFGSRETKSQRVANTIL